MSASLLMKILALIAKLFRLIEDLVVGDFYTVFESGDESGATDSGPVKVLMETGRLNRLAPGTYYLRKTTAGMFASFIGQKGETDLTGRDFVLVSDPSQDLGDGTPNLSYGQWWSVHNNKNFGLVGFSIRHHPDPTSEVEIVAINGATLTCRALPGRFPAFPFAGAFGYIRDKASGSFRGWRHLKVKGTNEPAARITPRPDLGPDMLTLEIPLAQSVITAVELQPGIDPDDVRMILTVADSTAFRYGDTVTIGGTVGLESGGQSVVNGRTFTIGFADFEEGDEPEGDEQTRIVLTSPLVNADRLFPDDTTAWISGGTIATVAPIYFEVGGVLALTNGKKRGGLFMVVGNKGHTRFRGRIDTCTGIGFWARDNEDLTFELDSHSPGLMTYSHGAAIVHQTWGRVHIPSYYAKGVGDSHWAMTALHISRIASVGTNTVTVASWGAADRMDGGTPAPRVGQEWGYLQPDGDISPVLNIVTAIAGNTVTFEQDHPTEFNPATWKIIATGANRELVIDTMHCEGAWTLGLALAFRRTHIGSLFISNVHDCALLVSNPSTFWRNRQVGGAYPGCEITITHMVAKNCGFNNRSYRSAIVAGRRLTATNEIATAGDNPIMKIGYLSADHYGFALAVGAGMDIRIGVVDATHKGEYRDNPDFVDGGVWPTAGGLGSKHDLFTVNGSNVSIGAITNDDGLTFYSENGGTYSPPGGSRMPQRGTALGGETTIPSPVPVPAGMEFMVQVFVGDLRLDEGVGFTADGSATLTLASPLPAGMTWRVQRAA